MSTESAAQQLASLTLGEDVTAYIGRKRAEGVSWRLIARDLYESTGHRVDVTHETLRSWYTDATQATA